MPTINVIILKYHLGFAETYSQSVFIMMAIPADSYVTSEEKTTARNQP